MMMIVIAECVIYKPRLVSSWVDSASSSSLFFLFHTFDFDACSVVQALTFVCRPRRQVASFTGQLRFLQSNDRIGVGLYFAYIFAPFALANRVGFEAATCEGLGLRRRWCMASSFEFVHHQDIARYVFGGCGDGDRVQSHINTSFSTCLD